MTRKDRGQMSTGGTIVALTVAVTIAIVLLPPVVASIGDNTGSQTVTNESVTADAGSYVELDGYNIDEGSETVRNASGSVMSSPGDYEMAYGNGSIKVNSSSTNIADGESITVSYTYQATSDTVATILGLAPLFVALLALVAVAGPMMERM